MPEHKIGTREEWRAAVEAVHEREPTQAEAVMVGEGHGPVVAVLLRAATRWDIL